MKMNPRDMDWKDFVHADHLTSLSDDDDDDKDNTMIDNNKWYNVTYMNTITPYYWKVERDGEYPHHGPVTAKQISGESLAEMVAKGGYLYNETYPPMEILNIEETHEVTWETVTMNGRYSCS